VSDAPKFGEPGWQPTMTPPPAGSPHYQAAAASAVGQAVTPDLGVDAGESIEQIKEQAVRAALSDFEAQLNDTLKRSQAAFSSQQDQIDMLTRQLSTVRQQAGPPVAGLLADSLATRVKSIAIANPDLGAKHFAGIISQTESLADEVKGLAAGDDSATSDRVEQLASSVYQWFTRVHMRTSGKFLEGAGAALDEAERLVEELPNLAPVAGALARAL
jgi:hypothetical protein